MQLGELSQNENLIKSIKNLLLDIEPPIFGLIENPMLELKAIEILYFVESYILFQKSKGKGI